MRRRSALWMRCGLTTAFCVSALSGASIPSLQAADWVDYATVSMTDPVTPKLTNRHLCLTDGADVLCASPSPYLTSGGLLGIGTTDPQTALEVSGTISATAFVGDGSGLTNLSVSGDRITSGTSNVIVNSSGAVSFTTAGAERMVINSLGNVGIGTTTPTMALVVSGTIGTPDATNYIVAGINGGTSVVLPSLLAAGGNPATNNDRIRFGWHRGAWPTSPLPAQVVVDDNGILHLAGRGNAASGIRFYTSGTIPSAERMRIDSAGNVGIGTTSPNASLDVSGSIYLGNGGYSDNVRIGFSNPARNGDAAYIEYDGVGDFTGSVIFATVANVANEAATEKMRIHANGNVGIGNATPKAKLDVTGAISASDIVQVGSTTTIACGSSVQGAIRYTNVSDTLQICTGSGWKSLISSSVAGADNLGNHTATQTLEMAGYGINAAGNVSGTAFYSGDANAYFYNNGSIPSLVLDTNDYLRFTRATNTLDWLVGGTPKLTVDSAGKVGIFGNSDPQAALDATGGTVSATTYYASNGSVSVPAYSFSNDTNLGLYRAAADVLGVTVGAANVVSISSGGIGANGVAVAGDVTATGVISASGYVIGSNSPAAAGAIRYNAASDTLQVYAGGWRSLVSGTASTAEGDRIISGTLAVIANSATSYVSLSSAGTTWGYLHSAASYLPQLTAGQVSSSNISSTLVTFSSSTITALGGPGGNFIASGTTSVSASSAGTIKFATADSQRMVIDSSGNVGIGATSPGAPLHVRSSSAYPQLRLSTAAWPAQYWDVGHNASTGTNDYGLSFQRSGTTYLVLGDQGNGDVSYFLTGKVGIGTTSPGVKLDVNGMGRFGDITNGSIAAGSDGNAYIEMREMDNAGTPYIDFINDSSTDYDARIMLTGNDALSIQGASIGVGVSTPTLNDTGSTVVHVHQASAAASAIHLTNSSTGFAASDGLILGRWSDGTNLLYTYESEPLTLATNGLYRLTVEAAGGIRFHAYGAGTLTTNASGVITASSDERLKDIRGEYSRGLADIVSLKPILYRWNKVSGLDDGHLYAGFSAQDVQKAIPEAIGQDAKGFLSLSDRPVMAAMVNAVKELKAANDNLSFDLKAANDNVQELRTVVDAMRAELRELKHANTQ